MKTWTSGCPRLGVGPRGSIKSGEDERSDSLERTALRSSASAANRNLSLIARARKRTTRGSSGPGRRLGVDLLWPNRGRPSAETERTLLRRPFLRRGEAGVDLNRIAASEEERSGEERSEGSSASGSASSVSAGAFWRSSPAAPEDSRTTIDFAFLLRGLRRGISC